MIEIFPGVFYDPAKAWYRQSPECIQAGQDLIASQPPSTSTTEPCAGGVRLVAGTWETTTPTGQFILGVTRHYLYPAGSAACFTKEFQDTVTVTPVPV